MDTEYKNKKNVTNPKRGYYSELVGRPKSESAKQKEPPGAPKRTKLTWQVKTERFAPILPSKLVPPYKGRYLAPAERWLTLDEEKQIAFPIEAFKPKVQLEYIAEPGELPRRVEIERKRREYCSHNIKSLLRDIGVRPEELISADIMSHEVTPKDKYGVNSTAHFLPLEIFDNEEFDCRTPDEWINLGYIDDVKHPVPAEAFLPKSLDLVQLILNNEITHPITSCYDWLEVAVTDYDKDNKLYTVLTLDGSETTHHIHRNLLMFKAEDPINFAARVKDAIKGRDDAENEINSSSSANS